MIPFLRLVWPPRGYHNHPVLMSAAINIVPYHIYLFAIDPSGAVFIIRRQLAVQSDATFSYCENVLTSLPAISSAILVMVPATLIYGWKGYPVWR